MHASAFLPVIDLGVLDRAVDDGERRRRNSSGRGRPSFPLFFDPAFDASVATIPGLPVLRDGDAARWDGVDVHDLAGSYGDYLLRKVAKVFPQLVNTLDT